MGLISTKLCFLCMDTDRRENQLRAMQHNNAGDGRKTLTIPLTKQTDVHAEESLTLFFKMEHFHNILKTYTLCRVFMSDCVLSRI